MSKRETWRLREYWNQVGGILVEEFMMVKQQPDKTAARWLLDGLIILGNEKRTASAREVSIKGEDVIAVQVKAGRLGMYLMGQAYFSGLLLQTFQPKSIKTVAICDQSDSVMEALAKEHRIEVIVISDSYKK